MENKNFIFIAGLHRSGTTLLYDILKSHPEISGFSNTGMPMNEGQHLQNVYPVYDRRHLFKDITISQPGTFAFNKKSYMDENHHLATKKNAKKIFNEWSEYWDLTKNNLLEKSPPNLIRMRFLQKLFPNSKFIVIMRHPIPVAYATLKFNKGDVGLFIKHWAEAHNICYKDKQYLNNIHILKYEHLVEQPQNTVDSIFNFLNLQTINTTYNINNNINEKYLNMWKKDNLSITDDLKETINKFGYKL